MLYQPSYVRLPWARPPQQQSSPADMQAYSAALAANHARCSSSIRSRSSTNSSRALSQLPICQLLPIQVPAAAAASIQQAVAELLSHTACGLPHFQTTCTAPGRLSQTSATLHKRGSQHCQQLQQDKPRTAAGWLQHNMTVLLPSILACTASLAGVAAAPPAIHHWDTVPGSPSVLPDESPGCPSHCRSCEKHC